MIQRQSGAPRAPDAEVHARAGELLLLLWNRRTADGLDIRGDHAVLQEWERGAETGTTGGRHLHPHADDALSPRRRAGTASARSYDPPIPASRASATAWARSVTCSLSKMADT